MLIDKFITFILIIGLPVVQFYHCLTGSLFLNTASQDAKGLDRVADLVLAPAHYLFCASQVSEQQPYSFTQRFSYEEHFLLKSAVSMVALPLSLGLGAGVKAFTYLFPEVRERHDALAREKRLQRVESNIAHYYSIGMKIEDLANAPFIESPAHTRRPGDEKHMQVEKEGLREVVEILKAHGIPFWVDCGTLLGAYRYGGIIPWDWDLDIAVLQPEFENVRHALSALDPERFDVQDWSGRECPKTYLKVYVKGTTCLIDIYHFAIDEEAKAVHSVFSNEKCPFLPESMKIRERRYVIATPFDHIFPLKKAYFDGIEVPVPAKTREYLQQRYGEDIGPVKIYTAETGRYEKDLNHPYWKMAHAR
jgi:hypothetical protein